MTLQFDLWLHLARTDKIGLAKLVLVSRLSREFLSAFDEGTIDGIIRSFVTMSDWPLIEQNIAIWSIGGKGESAAAFRKHFWPVDLLQLAEAAMRRRAGPGVLTAHVPGETSLSLSDISVYGQSPDKKAPHTRVR